MSGGITPETGPRLWSWFCLLWSPGRRWRPTFTACADGSTRTCSWALASVIRAAGISPATGTDRDRFSFAFAVCVITKAISVCFIFIRYGKAFETEPTLHSGINVVVLLMAAGHDFETSIEIRKIGAWNDSISNLLSVHHIKEIRVV